MGGIEAHVLPDALLLLWRPLFRLAVQLLVQLCVRLPQITQPSLHLHTTYQHWHQAPARLHHTISAWLH